MAMQNGYTVVTDLRSKPGVTVQRRRRKQSVKIERNIDEDALMASAIGDVTWLQQSLYDTRKVYSVSKEHVRIVNENRAYFPVLFLLSPKTYENAL